MNRSLSPVLAALVLLAAGGFAQSSFAADTDGQWARTHPRREEVNQRLANQNRRITQERVMASHNGGHITRAEQRALNQQENAVSKQIGK
jgi:hypothetical protein